MPAPAEAEAPLTVASAADFSAFAGAWWRHGFTLTIKADGSAEAIWRIYRWCDAPGVTPPCDRIENQFILSGGWAAIRFHEVDGLTARGHVLFSNDYERLAPGAIALTLLPYGMARLEQTDRSLILCGREYFTSAPASVRMTHPCGA